MFYHDSPLMISDRALGISDRDRGVEDVDAAVVPGVFSLGEDPIVVANNIIICSNRI